MLEKLPPTVGEALSEVRAGLSQTMFQGVDLRQGMARVVVSSLAFADHGPIPEKYTADGAGVSPPLQWHGVPAAASEVVLIVEDADSPTPQPLVHAIAHGLPAGEQGGIAEAALGAVGDAESQVAMGRNSLLQQRWLPPDPPPGHGVHRYLFQVFALEPGEPLPAQPGRDALRQAVLQRGLASGCLVGTYERPSGTIADPLAQGLAVAGPAAGHAFC